MALTTEERSRLMDFFEQMDEAEKKKRLSSLQAFSNWLKEAAASIYNKVKDGLQGLWQSICDFFS